MAPFGENDTLTPAPDEAISYEDGLQYWNSVDSTVNGMLGGYPQVSRVDLQGSQNFLAKLRRSSKYASTSGKSSRLLDEVVDCGAGIGRVTIGFLSKVAAEVDLVELVEKFTNEFKERVEVSGPGGLRELGKCGKIHNIGLQHWIPEKNYDLIWIQWCLGYLTDAQLVMFLKRCANSGLKKGGWIVVKENNIKGTQSSDLFDKVDSSVTRTNQKYLQLFKQAELTLIMSELQKGFPKDLYPVRMYALRPLK